MAHPVMPLPPPRPAAAPPINQTARFAQVTSFIGAVTGLSGLIVGLTLPVSLIVGVVAVVLGHIARAQVKRTGEDGGREAVLAIVIGYITIAGSIIVMVLLGIVVYILWMMFFGDI